VAESTINSKLSTQDGVIGKTLVINLNGAKTRNEFGGNPKHVFASASFASGLR
jgi:hypothetical protein